MPGNGRWDAVVQQTRREMASSKISVPIEPSIPHAAFWWHGARPLTETGGRGCRARCARQLLALVPLVPWMPTTVRGTARSPSDLKRSVTPGTGAVGLARWTPCSGVGGEFTGCPGAPRSTRAVIAGPRGPRQARYLAAQDGFGVSWARGVSSKHAPCCAGNPRGRPWRTSVTPTRSGRRRARTMF